MLLQNDGKNIVNIHIDVNIHYNITILINTNGKYNQIWANTKSKMEIKKKVKIIPEVF